MFHVCTAKGTLAMLTNDGRQLSLLLPLNWFPTLLTWRNLGKTLYLEMDLLIQPNPSLYSLIVMINYLAQVPHILHKIEFTCIAVPTV